MLTPDNGIPLDRYLATASGRIVLNRFVSAGYPFRLERGLIFFFRRSSNEPNPVGRSLRHFVLSEETGAATPPALRQAVILVDRSFPCIASSFVLTRV